MILAIALASVLLEAIGLWIGWKRIDLPWFWGALAFIFGLLLQVVSVIQLGTPGVVLLIVGLLLGLVLLSLRLHADFEKILVSASARSTNDLQDLIALERRLRTKRGAVGSFGPLERAKLIALLSGCGRCVGEIEVVAPHVANLSVGFEIPLEELVEPFDRAMRLWGVGPEEAQRLADNIAHGAKTSAGSAQEFLAGLIAFKSDF